MLLSTIAAVALCRSPQLSAAVTGIDRTAGHVHALVAVKNIAQTPCAIGPYPGIMLVDANQNYGKELRVAPAQSARRIVLETDKVASFAISWESGVAQSTPCPQMNTDALLFVGGGGLPLWIPLGANSCGSLSAAPYESGLQSAPPLSLSDAALGDYANWQVAQPCKVAFLRTEHFDRGPASSAPAVHDALPFPYPTTPISAAATRPDVELPTAYVDAQKGAFVESSEDFGQFDVFACSRILSIPSMIQRRDLHGTATVRRVTLGMSSSQVEHVEGVATLHAVAASTSILFYRWRETRRGEQRLRTLCLAFWKGKLFGIHYEDAPVQRAP